MMITPLMRRSTRDREQHWVFLSKGHTKREIMSTIRQLYSFNEFLEAHAYVRNLLQYNVSRLPSPVHQREVVLACWRFNNPKTPLYYAKIDDDEVKIDLTVALYSIEVTMARWLRYRKPTFTLDRLIQDAIKETA